MIPKSSTRSDGDRSASCGLDSRWIANMQQGRARWLKCQRRRRRRQVSRSFSRSLQPRTHSPQKFRHGPPLSHRFGCIKPILLCTIASALRPTTARAMEGGRPCSTTRICTALSQAVAFRRIKLDGWRADRGSSCRCASSRDGSEHCSSHDCRRRSWPASCVSPAHSRPWPRPTPSPNVSIPCARSNAEQVGMLPSPPLTDPDVQISRIRFFTREICSRRRSRGGS